MSEKKIVVVDLDGTLCEQVDTRTHPMGIYAYVLAAPKLDVISYVNELYDAGWRVYIHTARGMRTFNGDVNEVERELRSLTEQWLKAHGLKFHWLSFGKQPADMYLDDKAVRPDEITRSKEDT